MTEENKGFDALVIADYKARMKTSGRNFIPADPKEDNDEYHHVYFVGTFEGHEVIFDAVVYTLRLQHESELFALAEEKAAARFPDYRDLLDTPESTGHPAEREKEIGLFIAEAMAEMEEEEQVKVCEHADVDTGHDFGIGLDVGLNEEVITPARLVKLVEDFNADRLQLDDTLVSFQTEEEEE